MDAGSSHHGERNTYDVVFTSKVLGGERIGAELGESDRRAMTTVMLTFLVPQCLWHKI